MKRSLYDTLPPALQTQINQLIKEHSFADYSSLTAKINELLADSGYEVSMSRSTVFRLGTDLKKILDQIRQTQEASAYLMEAYPDDDKTTSQATLRLISDRLFRLVMEDDDLGTKDLSSIARAMADVARTDISVSKYKSEVKAKLEAKFAETATRSGIDLETLRVIREEIYGIVS